MNDAVAKGTCLCGKVAFQLYTLPRKYYRCHCSLCRKQSGTGHNLATLVSVKDFAWAEGAAEAIATWQRPQGYRNDFCRSCGSTVPNTLRNSPWVWIPAGLLDTRTEMTCAGDFCLDDAMPWDSVAGECRYGDAPASLTLLLTLLDLPAPE